MFFQAGSIDKNMFSTRYTICLFCVWSHEVSILILGHIQVDPQKSRFTNLRHWKWRVNCKTLESIIYTNDSHCARTHSKQNFTEQNGYLILILSLNGICWIRSNWTVGGDNRQINRLSKQRIPPPVAVPRCLDQAVPLSLRLLYYYLFVHLLFLSL